MPFTGKCLCGSVTYEYDGPPGDGVACHWCAAATAMEHRSCIDLPAPCQLSLPSLHRRGCFVQVSAFSHDRECCPTDAKPTRIPFLPLSSLGVEAAKMNWKTKDTLSNF